MASLRLRFACVALLCSALSAHAGVLVVDKAGGPGADFEEIQQAVDAAIEGDTILVRDGSYGAFQVAAVSVSVVADGAQVMIAPPTGQVGEPMIVVRDLAASQMVLIRGLRASLGVRVSACLGAVWFDELECSGISATTCNVFPIDGAWILDSPRVTFTRCRLTGEQAVLPAAWSSSAARGLRSFASGVQLLDCMITGGAGPSAGLGQPALSGGAGLALDASTVTAIGCTIRGGPGGLNGNPLCSVAHAPGGPGVWFGATSTLRSAESTAAGGVASLGPLCPGQAGPQGPAISGSGTIVALPGFARHLRANSPVRGGRTLTFELQGQPGELPLLLVSLVHEPLPLLNGSLLVGLPPTDVLLLPALSASGQASLAFPVPNVGAIVGSLAFYAQAAFLDRSPRVWLGAGTTVVLLDASY